MTITCSFLAIVKFLVKIVVWMKCKGRHPKAHCPASTKPPPFHMKYIHMTATVQSILSTILVQLIVLSSLLCLRLFMSFDSNLATITTFWSCLHNQPHRILQFHNHSLTSFLNMQSSAPFKHILLREWFESVIWLGVPYALYHTVENSIIRISHSQSYKHYTPLAQT